MTGGDIEKAVASGVAKAKDYINRNVLTAETDPPKVITPEERKAKIALTNARKQKIAEPNKKATHPVYEYVAVSSVNETNEKAKEGWRLVTVSPNGSFILERLTQSSHS